MGWASNHTGDPDFNPYGQIAIHCKFDGTFYAPTSTVGYMAVNSNNLFPNSTTYEYMLSLSGRDYLSPNSSYGTHNVYYTFFSQDEQDVLCKEVPWFSGSLRKDAQASAIAGVYPNPFSERFLLKSSLGCYQLTLTTLEGGNEQRIKLVKSN